ncbi:hypothetical protein Tco_0655696 [Tanacetum coccineum]|uniref:DUF223 domain-containing protein n=1 Tax=Tanacetum coccineum TaxID=301880 RepID=A0ABQ4X7W5_9ASTR
MLFGSSWPKPLLFLDQLEVDVTSTIVVMIRRVWDVNAVTRQYLSMDFVVSDSKVSAKSSVAYNFLRLKEGCIYSIKNFVVLPNKDEFRIFRHDMFMIEFDGETTTRKYPADISWYVTNVGRTSYTKTGSKSLESYLANQRGQSRRVTSWGELDDVLVEKKTKHARVCAMVLTEMSTKEYNNKLYLSSTSSMVFGNGYHTKGRKTKPKTTKLSTEWKCVKRRSQIEANKSTKSRSQQKSQTVKVKVNPDKVKSTPRS